jgi:hypothetical protein
MSTDTYRTAIGGLVGRSAVVGQEELFEGRLDSISWTPELASTLRSGSTDPRTWQRTTRPSTWTPLTPGIRERSGSISQATMRLVRVVLAIEPEEFRASRRGTDESEQQTDRRRLAGTIGPEIPEDLTLGHLEVQVAQGVGRSVGLG